MNIKNILACVWSAWLAHLYQSSYKDNSRMSSQAEGLVNSQDKLSAVETASPFWRFHKYMPEANSLLLKAQ